MIRRRVQCWICGRAARRVARDLVPVVGRRTLVRSYGTCPTCGETMLRRRDLRFVLRAALQHERQGWNRTEADL